jgi:hypothetical protein
VRERHVGRCTPHALALYLFLITVADAQGLSYYSDGAIAARLGWPEAQVRAARGELIGADLLAFAAPLYQVLSLDGIAPIAVREPASLASQPLPSARERAHGELRALRSLLKEVAS